MNVFNKVTLQSLKKNKTRTIVTIIGIMLSAAMICAVTTFVSSMQNYALSYAIHNDGDWHGMVASVAWEDYDAITASEQVESAVYNQVLGYAEIDTANQYKPYLYVIGGDGEAYFNTMPVHLLTGEYPKNNNEIILPDHLFSNGNAKYKVGDTITLELGVRMIDAIYSLWQSNPYYTTDDETGEEVLNDETLEVRETRTYTVVGTYERPSFEGFSAPGYTAITVADNGFSEDILYDVYFKINKPAEVYEYMQTLGLGGTQNTDVLMFSGVSRYSNFTQMLLGLAVIVMGLIMFGSVALIYNAFAISVSERTKQFGLLSSVGATKKQLKKMVLFEALSVSAVGIPLGIFVGIAGIGITLLLIGSRFNLFGGSFDTPMRICVSLESIVIAVVVALITVLISAWIPSKRATKISAVEAIRQSSDIKAKNKPVKTSKLMYALFGLPGVLANKHYNRNRKKYRTTVLSLFMSIVLFVSASSFTDYLIESVEGGYASADYDLSYMTYDNELNGHTPDDVLNLLMSDEDVTSGAYIYDGFFEGIIPLEQMTDEYISLYDIDAEDTVVGRIAFVNDSEFDRLLNEYGLDRSQYYDKNTPLGITFENATIFDREKGKYVTRDFLKSDQLDAECSGYKDTYNGFNFAGTEVDANGKRFAIYRNPENYDDYLEVDLDDARYRFTLHSEKVLNEFPYYIENNLCVLYPVSMLDAFLPAEKAEDFAHAVYYLQSDDHGASYDRMKAVLLENNLSYSRMYDYAADQETSRNLVLVIEVFSYGFIVLISLIAAANVFNTISTNISLRRREFAMLKSVGMTERGFNKMMNFECLLYGSKALLLGLPASAGVTYLIYRAIGAGYETVYHLPWGAIGIAILSVFLVVFATMMYSMSKVKKDNPIDALKNENL